MSKKTGLAIISGLIEALNELANVAQTIISEEGESTTTGIRDSKFDFARAKLGRALASATVPEREKWLREVDNYIRPGHFSVLEHECDYIAKPENYGFTHSWYALEIRDMCREIAKKLMMFESKVRKEADEASRKILQLLE